MATQTLAASTLAAVTVAVSSFVLMTGCSGEEAEPRSSNARTPTVVMFPDLSTEDLPKGCTLVAVESSINRFLVALSNGNKREILSTIAPSGEFNAMALGPASSPVLESPMQVVRRARAQQHYRINRSLDSAQVQPIKPRSGRKAGPYARPRSGPEADAPVVAIGLRLNLIRPQKPPTIVVGKAGLNCATGRFYVWATG